MISVAEDVRDIAGWPAVEWGMSEDEVRTALAGRATPIVPVARFANGYAAIRGSLTIEGCRFGVFPQFSHDTGEPCQVVFRGGGAEAGRLERMSEVLTACYGRPGERGTKRTWWGPSDAVQLDIVEGASREDQMWLRWYPHAGDGRKPGERHGGRA